MSFKEKCLAVTEAIDDLMLYSGDDRPRTWQEASKAFGEFSCDSTGLDEFQSWLNFFFALIEEEDNS